MGTTVLRVLVPLLGAASLLVGFAWPARAETIERIEIASEVPPAEIRPLITLTEGATLSDLDVRRTLANLQASGSVERAAIYRRPVEGDRVVVVVAAWANVVVDAVRIEGDLGLKRADLERQVPQQIAQPLAESAVVRGVFALQELYEREGYLTATVRVKVVTPSPRHAEVTYRVEAGPRTLVGEISFDGPLGPFSREALREPLREKGDRPYRPTALEDDADRLRRWLVQEGFRRARVDPPRAVLDGQGRMGLTYPIDVGPKVEITIRGAERAKLEKRGLLPILDPDGFDEALLLATTAKLRTDFQSRGHYRVEVESQEKPIAKAAANVASATGTEIEISIDPGPVYTLARVDLTGDAALDESELRKRMAVTADKAFGRARLVDSELDRDLANLRSFYLLSGFVEAKVGPPRILVAGTEIAVEIPIVEGRREIVGEVRWSGFEAIESVATAEGVALQTLRRDLAIVAGGPFHPQRLDEALSTLREGLEAVGYGDAQVSATSTWNPEHTKVDLTFQALLGSKITVDRVIVRGNRRTLGSVIARNGGISTGDAVSERRLLEVERSLYRLGIFSRVDVQRTRSALEESTRDVLIRVQEGKPIALTYGLGYDSDDGVRGLIGVRHSNVNGRANTLRSDLRVARDASRFRVLFDQPFAFEQPFSLTSSVFYEQGPVGQRAFSLTRYGARTEATRLFSRGRRFSLGLDFRIVEIDQLNAEASLNDLERRDRPVEITSLQPSWFVDRRDDPLVPTRGWNTLAQGQYAFPALGSDGHFAKLFVQGAKLFEVRGPRGRRAFGSLAASLRLGAIEAFGDLPVDNVSAAQDLASRNVFISERFFAGGGTTHRAYGRDELGIRGETLIFSEREQRFIEIGGNALVLANVEWRFPIAGTLGGALFVDAGNVWSDWRRVSFEEIKTGVGIGIRYLSPIGPLRIDFGWKLDRETGESRGANISVTFGNPF